MAKLCTDCKHLEIVTVQMPDEAANARVEELERQEIKLKDAARNSTVNGPHPHRPIEEQLAAWNEYRRAHLALTEHRRNNTAELLNLRRKMREELQPGARCVRPTGLTDPVHGDPIVLGLDAVYERTNTAHKIPQIVDQIPLCGPEGQFFSLKDKVTAWFDSHKDKTKTE